VAPFPIDLLWPCVAWATHALMRQRGEQPRYDFLSSFRDERWPLSRPSYLLPQLFVGALPATSVASNGPTPEGLVPVQGSSVVMQPHWGLSGEPKGM
jgi:hypothetical protein